jgi:hypothetical protein
VRHGAIAKATSITMSGVQRGILGSEAIDTRVFERTPGT